MGKIANIRFSMGMVTIAEINVLHHMILGLQFRNWGILANNLEHCICRSSTRWQDRRLITRREQWLKLLRIFRKFP